MSQKLAVVVTGGTGKQGGAVVKSLLERGHEVRAVTRSTDSGKAREHFMRCQELSPGSDSASKAYDLMKMLP